MCLVCEIGTWEQIPQAIYRFSRREPMFMHRFVFFPMVIRPYICGLYSTVKIPWNVCSQSIWSPGPTTSLCDTLLSICTASKCMTALWYSLCGDSWLHSFNSSWNNEKGDRQSDDLSKVSCPMGWIHVQHELLKHLRRRLQRSQKKEITHIRIIKQPQF